MLRSYVPEPSQQIRKPSIRLIRIAQVNRFLHNKGHISVAFVVS